MKPLKRIQENRRRSSHAIILCHVVVIVIAGLMVATTPGSAAAQQNAVTIQLPTYSSFSVSTTVLVPDRGSAALGGIGRSAMGASQFGPAPLPAGTRAIGVERQAQNAHVFAQIHDFREMEQALIGDGAGNDVGRLTVLRPNGLTGAAVHPRPVNIGQRGGKPLAVQASGDVAGQLSVEEWKRLRAQQAADQERQVKEWMQRAAAADESGNRGAARVYLNMAYRQADAELRPQIAAELERLAAPAASKRPR